MIVLNFPLKSTLGATINTPKELDNSLVVEELQHYQTFTQAVEDYRFLDNIIVGVCNLDLGGNTRPLPSGVVFTLLSTMETIYVKNVIEAHQCSESHARKITACLRIASREVQKCLAMQHIQSLYNGGIWPQTGD